LIFAPLILNFRLHREKHKTSGVQTPRVIHYLSTCLQDTVQLKFKMLNSAAKCSVVLT